MTQSQLTRLTVFILTLGILSTAGWAIQAWAASQPVASASVLGISTTANPSLQTPTLLPYPRYLTTQQPNIGADEYALYNVESGKFLYQSDDQSPVPIASTTKVMTTYLAATLGNPDDVVTISQEAGSQIGSLMGIYPGEHMTVRNLLYGALMVSGNDAAHALGEYVGGKLLNDPNASVQAKVDREVQAMNDTAKTLHMASTHYMDPAGLNDDGHSTATDLARLVGVFNQQPLIQQIITTPRLTVMDTDRTAQYDLENSDRLTTQDPPFPGNLGGKTGNTPAAGHCLVTTAKRNGMTLIAVILHTTANDNDASAREARKLLEFGFANVRLDSQS